MGIKLIEKMKLQQKQWELQREYDATMRKAKYYAAYSFDTAMQIKLLHDAAIIFGQLVELQREIIKLD